MGWAQAGCLSSPCTCSKNSLADSNGKSHKVTLDTRGLGGGYAKNSYYWWQWAWLWGENRENSSLQCFSGALLWKNFTHSYAEMMQHINFVLVNVRSGAGSPLVTASNEFRKQNSTTPKASLLSNGGARSWACSAPGCHAKDSSTHSPTMAQESETTDFLNQSHDGKDMDTY